MPALQPGEVLHYWFGPEGCGVRAVLWIQGLRPDDPKQGAGEEIARLFGPWIQAWGGDLSGGEVPSAWQETPEGLVALVILFGAFPRLAYAGTAEMFAYDPLAQRYASTALTHYTSSSESSFPWQFSLFCHLAYVQSEDLGSATAAAADIVRLSEEVTRGASDNTLSIGKGIYRYFYQAVAKPAISLLRQFGRDPQRNVLLGRTSTSAEVGWLKTKKAIPEWARPAAPARHLPKAFSAQALEPPRLRILVLHGRPQSAQSFKKLTKGAFAALRQTAELVFADAPHAGGAGGRAWWDAVTDSEGGMRYVGLGASLAHLQDFVASAGPFDGVLGFSQGACLAAILAALPPEQRGGLNFRFFILISGFYCRDAERISLHLEGCPERHAPPPAIAPRRNSIHAPSFHIRGIGDAKVEAWRAQALRDCFVDAREATHAGGHLAVDQWPMADVVQWTRQFESSEALVTPGVGSHDAVRGIVAESPFELRCEALRRLPRLPTEGGTEVGVPDVPNKFFRCADVRDSPLWLRICRRAPIFERHGLTQVEAQMFVIEAVAARGEVVLEDLFLLAWHLYPFPGLRVQHRQEPKDPKLRPETRQWGQNEGKGFLWLFRAAWEVASPALRKEQLQNLVACGSWGDMAQLGFFAATGAARGWALDGTEGAVRDASLTEALLSEVAEAFARQLHQDSVLAAKVIAEVSADESRTDGAALQIARILDASSGRYTLPSDCVRFAPRFGSAVQRAGGLALRVASLLYELRNGVTVTDRERFRARLDADYRGVLRRVTHCLDLHSAKRLEDLRRQEKEIWSRAFLSEEEFERMRRSPLSDAIRHPIPQPVEVAPASELAPLYDFLNSGSCLQPNTLGDMTFDRGTVTTDRRLDLCKQVIGPAGITGLFDALAKDRESQRHVQHLLLGNNICGVELPRKVAEYIRSGNSQLTTWYIAGNRLTGDSLAPLCEVLETDNQVKQLWLKRNPLHVEGAQRLARLLSANSCLQVLDVSFCGLLDAGAEALVQALKNGNRSVRHLYLDANGLSEAAATLLAGYLAAEGARLESLSMGLNRLYDGGAKALADVLAQQTSLQKFCVASAGIGPLGVEALAGALRTNRDLVELDVGFLKATAATGELPNRAEDRGCGALAAALAENSTLRALKLNHNAVGLDGRRALHKALCGEYPNRTLVALEVEQYGMPHELPFLRDELAAALARNLAGLTDLERTAVQSALRPHHLSEIASVYRLGNVYSPGPPADNV
jgi:uncharacterized protein (DUF924 family)/Ran GTPase-activating protein (RanGAP) involved in mRNA processing and transport